MSIRKGKIPFIAHSETRSSYPMCARDAKFFAIISVGEACGGLRLRLNERAREDVSEDVSSTQ